MPYSNELKQKETHSKETERDNANQVLQWGGQSSVGYASSDEGGSTSTGNDNASFFSFIREAHLQEAQEFRRKGYNSQVPEVDLRLVGQLREALATTKSRLYVQVSVGAPLGSLWLLEQIGKIERLSDKLSENRLHDWVKHELPHKSSSGDAEISFGSRSAAQSLTRRLESTLQTLINVVHTLRAIDDYSTPEKRHDMLVSELVDVFSPNEKNTVIQALGRMTADIVGNAAWSSLMQARAATWEADQGTSIGAMIESTRYEAGKANQKARELRDEPQAFFSNVAAYLQSFSSDLAKVSININQSAPVSVMPYVNDDGAEPLSRSNTLMKRLKIKKAQGQIVLAMAKRYAYRGASIIRHGDLTETPAKEPEHVITDSIIRSILWQWQQPASKIQYASAALLSKVDELQKIAGILLSFEKTHDRGGEEANSDISASNSNGNGMDAQIRQWVNDSIDQEKTENQLAAKVSVLEQLFEGDITNARQLVLRFGKTEESLQNLLRRQRFAVLKMTAKHLSADAPALPALKEVAQLLPAIAKALTASLSALDNALLSTESPSRDFVNAKEQAVNAQLLATEVKESLSAESARLTGRPLDEYSRGSRLAKHWANLAKENNLSYSVPREADQVHSSLKKQRLFAGILSSGDPAGYLFTTRLAGELENARNDELKLPMSPEQYAALEKELVEYIVKWGQKRISLGGARLIIELSFDHVLDSVTFNVSNFVRVPYKILKASIKIPYRVNKVNNYTMPGHDRPYKAIYEVLGKRLKQLGFNLLTAPVPGVVKLAVGAGITASAVLHNLQVEHREKTFSAVYQRVAGGAKSEKIKMDSLGGMIFDSVVDSTSMAVFKGIHKSRQPEYSENDIINDQQYDEGLKRASGIKPSFRTRRSPQSSSAPVRLDESDASKTPDESQNSSVIDRSSSEQKRYDDQFAVANTSENLAASSERTAFLQEIADTLVSLEDKDKSQPVSDIKSAIVLDGYLYEKMKTDDAHKNEYKDEWLRIRNVLRTIDNEAVKRYLDFRLIIESHDVYKGWLLKSDMSDSRTGLVDDVIKQFNELESNAKENTITSAIGAFQRSYGHSLDVQNEFGINHIHEKEKNTILDIARIYFYLNDKEHSKEIDSAILAIINKYLPIEEAVTVNERKSPANIMTLVSVLEGMQNMHRKAYNSVKRVDNLINVLSTDGKELDELLLDARIIAAQLYDGVNSVSLTRSRGRWINRYENIKRDPNGVSWKLIQLEAIINYLQKHHTESDLEFLEWEDSFSLMSMLQEDNRERLRGILFKNTFNFTPHLGFKTRQELGNDDKKYYSQFDNYIDGNGAKREAGSQLYSVVERLQLSIAEVFSRVEDVKIVSYIYNNRDGGVVSPAPGRVIIIKLKGSHAGAVVISNLFFNDYVKRITNEEYNQLSPIFNGNDQGDLTHRSLKSPYYYRGTQAEHTRLSKILTGMDENQISNSLKKLDIWFGHPARFSIEYPEKESTQHLRNKTLQSAIIESKALENKAAVSYLRSAMYSLTDWEKIAHRFVPFYEIVHRSETDREYSIDAEQFTLDLIAAITIAYPTVKGITATIRSSSVSSILKSGLKGSALLQSLGAEIGRLGFSAGKVFGTAIYELVEPFPMNSHFSRTTIFDGANHSAAKAIQFPTDWVVDDLSLSHVIPDNEGVYKVKKSEPQTMQDFNFYIKKDNKFYPVKQDLDNQTWRLIPPENSGKSGYQAPVRRNENGDWELHTDVGLRGGGLKDFLDEIKSLSLRDKSKGEIVIGEYRFSPIKYSQEKFNEMTRIASTYTSTSKSTERIVKLQQNYKSGKEMSGSSQNNHYNDLSLDEKLDLFINPETDAITRGVLAGKINESIKNINLYETAKAADAWKNVAYKSAKATDVVLVPQNIFLRGRAGECLPESVLMGWALQSGQDTAFVKKLMDIYSAPDIATNPLYKALVELHSEGNASRFSMLVATDVKMNKLSDEEPKVFPTENTAVRVDIPEHTMLISKVNQEGKINYIFYDPNYGIAYFKKYKDMSEFFKNTLESYNTPENATKFYHLDYSQLPEVKIRGKSLDEIINGEIPQIYRQEDVSLAGVTPQNGIYKIPETDKTYINVNDDVYQVEWDPIANTWRVFDPENTNRSRATVPVKRDADGEWFRHTDTGLKGGGLFDEIKNNWLRGRRFKQLRDFTEVVDLEATKWPAEPINKDIHMIWIGTKDMSEKNIGLSIETAQKNPDYNTTVIYDSGVPGYESAKDNMAEKFKGTNIKLIDIRDKAYIHQLQNELSFIYYEQALRSKSYAQASDVLRLLLLKYEGGIYKDVDDVQMKGFGSLAFPKGIGVMREYAPEAAKDSAFPNTPIAATKNNPVINRVLELAVENYRHGRKNILKLAGPDVFTDALYQEIPGMRPQVLSEQLGQFELAKRQALGMPLDKPKSFADEQLTLQEKEKISRSYEAIRGLSGYVNNGADHSWAADMAGSSTQRAVSSGTSTAFDPDIFKQALTDYLNPYAGREKADPAYAPYQSTFASLPNIRELTLQDVKDLKHALIENEDSQLAQTRYRYALLGYLSWPEEIKRSLDFNEIRSDIIRRIEHAEYVYNWKKQEKDYLQLQLYRAVEEQNVIRGKYPIDAVPELHVGVENKIAKLKDEIADKNSQVDYWKDLGSQLKTRLELWNDSWEDFLE